MRQNPHTHVMAPSLGLMYFTLTPSAFSAVNASFHELVATSSPAAIEFSRSVGLVQ